MTAAIVILSIILAILVGVVIYLFVMNRKNQKRVDELLSDVAAAKLAGYQALVKELTARVEKQRDILKHNAEKYAEIQTQIDNLPEPLKDPDKIVSGLAAWLKKEKEGSNAT